MKKITRLLFLALVLLCAFDVTAQEADTLKKKKEKNFRITKLCVETRADFEANFDKDFSSTGLGFRGRYLNVVLDGQITPKLRFSYRQRLNVWEQGFTNFFKGTDWAQLIWQAHKNIAVSGGKQVLMIGGWEYDLPPIDVFMPSEFWNTIPCYEIGASVVFNDNEGKHNIYLQVTNSPFATKALSGMFAYNLCWQANLGFFKPSYSFNMLESSKGNFISYIALGNKFEFEKCMFVVDFMNRASFKQQRYFFSDFTLTAEAHYCPTQRWDIFVKGGHDANHAQPADTDPADIFDLTVKPGVVYDFAGLGFTYCPLIGKHLVRLHFTASAGRMDGAFAYCLNTGLTWKIRFIQ